MLCHMSTVGKHYRLIELVLRHHPHLIDCYSPLRSVEKKYTVLETGLLCTKDTFLFFLSLYNCLFYHNHLVLTLHEYTTYTPSKLNVVYC